MTDKQIIIDGVDVSFCTHHYNGWSNLHRDTRPMCEIGYDRDCEPKHFECSHYVKCLEKQLKAKEQECERLRFPMQDTNYAILTKEEFEEYKKLKQTLTEIKEFVENEMTQNGDTYIILQKISEVENE